ncbi:MBL fold metallo-hydrolase [Jannaschia sp. CCS1]|uniref:MBL fold metallo-hydrolase n=1 Tax=Jannaschia sp. (strain CCS1) TaxID=290400 RepID=UPI000053DCA2|nr:MBL fold metallo-hydrolase [Jannaschia sp. CCS1]ABD54749.1 beta-lactamase-like protein [Jannaschia sp. CCS1]
MQSETRHPSSTHLAPDLRRITAPNPSPMTFTGTQTYILGQGEVSVIDPGPAVPQHMHAILGALQPGESVARILVTHSHLDHSPLARPLAQATGAPIFAAGPSDWGRSAVMTALGDAVGGGEGIDPDFAPDERIRGGDIIEGIEVLETPGHMANHLSFVWGDALFSGDLAMGWSTSLVSPPDGDMTAFFASLEMLRARQDRIYYPGHGEPVTHPQARCAELIAHRRGREAQILAALAQIGPASADTLARHIYTDVAAALLPAAARNVLAHLIDLRTRAQITTSDPLHKDALFACE